MIKKTLPLCGVVTALLLVGCNGSSSSNSGSTPSAPAPRAPAPNTPAPSTPTPLSSVSLDLDSSTNSPIILGSQATITGVVPTGTRTITATVSSATPSNPSRLSSLSASEAQAGSTTIYTAEIDDDNRYSVTVPVNMGSNTLTFTITSNDGTQRQRTQVLSRIIGQTVSAGGAHTGMITGGNTYVWGRNNKGQLGLGNITTISQNTDNPGTHPVTPVLLNTDATFVSLAFNQNTSLALDNEGNVWSWGYGRYGQLGLGDADLTAIDETDRSTPTKIESLSNVVAMTRSYRHSLVLRNDGTVCGFGHNSYGQLGNGTETHSDYPQCLAKSAFENNGIVKIATNTYTSFAVDTQGQLWGWGRNRYGILGQPSADLAEQLTPIKITLPSSVLVQDIAGGNSHILALTRSGEIYAWGRNSNSQVGMEDDWGGTIEQPRLLPWFNATEGTADAIWANGNQSFARKNGQIYPWGQNGNGQLGIETPIWIAATNDRPARFQDATGATSPNPYLDNFKELGIGPLHAIGVRNDNTVYTWGWSYEGSLGGGTDTINSWTYAIPQLIEIPTS